MRSYTQLTQQQRYQIYALMKANSSQVEIAQIVGVHKSTVSREVCRNRGLKGYRPQQAHRLAVHRRQDKAQGGNLYRRLRCQKARKKRYGTYDRRGQLGNWVSIDERPAVVERRTRLGDWELDTIIGRNHKQALVSLTERKSRLALIAKVPSKAAEGIKNAVLKLLTPLSSHVHTLTSDNGKEFAQHEAIAEALDADFYFAHPYASWERGLNENTNGLIRQYFPKGHDFTTIT